MFIHCADLVDMNFAGFWASIRSWTIEIPPRVCHALVVLLSFIGVFDIKIDLYA